MIETNFKWYKIKLSVGPRKVTYTFRGLTAEEVEKSQTKNDRFSQDLYVLKACVKDIESPETIPAGVADTLVEAIYMASGLSEDSSIFEEAIEWIKSGSGKAEALAVTMIPGLTLEHLRTCDPTYYAKYLLIGKLQFESLWGVNAENAFGLEGETVETPVEEFKEKTHELPKIPGPGEVLNAVDRSFSWHKGK